MNYEQMINENIKLIYKLAHKYTVYDYTYEDRVQECLTKLHLVYNKYNPKYSITTFIYNICKRHLLDLNDYQTTNRRVNKNNNNNIVKDIYTFDLDRLESKQALSLSEKEETTLDIIEEQLELLNDKKKSIMVNVLNGLTYENVGINHECSKQYVHLVYKDFINKCRNLLDLSNCIALKL